MNTSSIQPIGSAQQTENSMLSKLTATQTEILQNRLAAAAQLHKTHPEAKTEGETKTDQVSNLENVSIHFRVDDKSNAVTIFLVDRKSRKVLRSIPASELQKMQIGDLLKLTV
ncbi:flagellar protein FlaG [bacterium]|nr:flagellar protein FlaG [bacterium]